MGRALLRGINRLDRSQHLSNRDAGAGTIPSVVPRRGLAGARVGSRVKETSGEAWGPGGGSHLRPLTPGDSEA